MTRTFLTMTILMILAFSFIPNSIALTINEQDAIITGNETRSSAGTSTYITGAWNVSYSTLRALVGGDIYMNYDNFCRIIEEYFLPFNQRIVGLFMGWDQHANTSTTDIPYYEWVDDWLSACDKYGIGNLFYFGQWGTSHPAPSWWSDVLEAYPDLQSYDRNGSPVLLGKANPLSIDNPQLIRQFEEDLKQLWEYYGEHPSWVGWGAFPGDFAHYARTDALVSDVGFANYSVYNFAKTIYYLKDVNETGFHEDGTKCKIWKAFLEYQPLKVFGYGNVQDGEGYDVYGGTEKGGRLVAMKFKAPENMTGFKIKWYGRRKGQPPNSLILELYEDENDAPHNLGTPIESIIQTDEIGTNPDWQPIVSFVSNLIEDKYYWIVFQTMGGDGSNKYQVYARDFKTDESTCKVSGDGYFSTQWKFRGSAILWIQDARGIDKKIYPMQKSALTPNVGDLTQTFTPTEDITINTIFLNVVDRQFDETPTTVQLIRVEDGTVLASGLLDQKLISGVYFWVPIILDKRIEVRAGVQYGIRLPRTAQRSSWQWHYIRTDPPTQGFQGQTKTFMFKLADMNLSILQNYMRSGAHVATGLEAGTPGVTYTSWYAVRFKPTIEAPLSTVDVKIHLKYGEPTGLKIALREDYDGNGTRPANIDLESKFVPTEKTPLGMGWINTTGWTTPLKANNWYWIVFSMAAAATNSGYRLTRVTNPIEYKMLWTTDSGSSWKRHPEIGELIFKAATTAEVFKVEPENVQFSADLTRITDKDLMAQSFSPASNIVAKGVLVFIIRGEADLGGDFTAELRRDSGMDTPSMMVLTAGNLSLKSISKYGMQYVDFKFPIPLTAGEKYWIVFRSTKDAKVNCPYYMFREPEDSFGGTDHKVKRSTDGGWSWDLPGGKEADIIFGVVQPTVVADYEFYETADLSADIAKYHAREITDEPFSGWNTYLNLQTSKILKEATEWFEEYTSRRWHVIDVNTVRIIDEVGGSKYLSKMALGAAGPAETPPSNSFFFNDTVSKISALLASSGVDVYPWSSWGHWGHGIGRITPEQVGVYYRMTLPLLARAVNFFDWDPTRLMDDTQQKWSRRFGEILNRMRYYGGYYGSEKGAVNALFIGDKDIGITLQFLTPALNVTLHGFHGLNGDYNLTKFGDFHQFDVIVWWAEGPSMREVTSNVQKRVKAFVQNGGGLVVTGRWPDWANDVLGFDYTDERIIPGNLDYVDYGHPILKPYTDVSGYSYYCLDRKVIPYEADPGKFIIKDTNGIPWISEHTYDLGRGIFIGMPCENWFQFGAGTHGSPRESYLVLLNNAIFYAAKKENMLPVWWFTDYKTQYLPWHTQLWYSINGKPGEPVLLWLTNNYNATSFEIHLNATFYGIDPNGWIAIDAWNWTAVAKGAGNDIKINVTIPERSWKPIYICNQAIDMHEIYSNILILKRAFSPIQAAYTLQALYKQTSWLIINSTRPVAEVILNEESFLPKHTSIGSLNSTDTLDGWFRDSANGFLYIKFKPTSTINILRINLETTLPIYEQYPYLIPIAAVVVITAIEVVIWAKRQRKAS